MITALPDSVIAKPLGPVERTRAGRDRLRRPPPPAGDDRQVDRPSKRASGGAAGEARAAARDPGLDARRRRGWIYEIKFDGYRVMARIEGARPGLITRGGHDWTAKMKSLAAAVEALGIDSAWLDGEIVVLADKGIPDFNALQNAFDTAHTERIVYFLFDVPFFEGYDLRKVPLHSRRALLKRLLDAKGGERVRFSEDFPVPPAQMLQAACEMKLGRRHRQARGRALRLGEPRPG